MKSNIALVGFMGSGKTAVGTALAAALNRDFIDLDILIEEKNGHSIADIFALKGEGAFREMETAALQEACHRKGAIISCGGGIVLKPANAGLLKQSAAVVYLIAAPADILQRLAGSKTRRPLLETPDPTLKVRELLEFRKPLYEAVADVTVDTSGLTIDEVVEKIKAGLLQHESTDFQKQHTR